MSQLPTPAPARVEEAASASIVACLDDVMAAMSRVQDRLREAGINAAVADEVDQLYDFLEGEVGELQEQIIDEFERKQAAAPARAGSPK
jgi:hypothetical protein